MVVYLGSLELHKVYMYVGVEVQCVNKQTWCGKIIG